MKSAAFFAMGVVSGVAYLLVMPGWAVGFILDWVKP